MWALITAALKFFGIIGSDVGKQQDANAAAVQKQGGVDAERAAGLATVNAIQAKQAKAMVNAPSNVDSVVDLARNGGL